MKIEHLEEPVVVPFGFVDTGNLFMHIGQLYLKVIDIQGCPVATCLNTAAVTAFGSHENVVLYPGVARISNEVAR